MQGRYIKSDTFLCSSLKVHIVVHMIPSHHVLYNTLYLRVKPNNLTCLCVFVHSWTYVIDVFYWYQRNVFKALHGLAPTLCGQIYMYSYMIKQDWCDEVF